MYTHTHERVYSLRANIYEHSSKWTDRGHLFWAAALGRRQQEPALSERVRPLGQAGCLFSKKEPFGYTIQFISYHQRPMGLVCERP